MAASGDGGYGPLAPAPDLRDGALRLALPDGFQYRSFSVSGDLMSDGHRVPIAMDGMGAFNMGDGKIRLVRNHEDRNAAGAGTVPVDGRAYDRKGGGTSTIEINPFTRELERDFVRDLGSLAIGSAVVRRMPSRAFGVTAADPSPVSSSVFEQSAFLYKDPGGPVLRFCAKKDETLRAAAGCLLRKINRPRISRISRMPTPGPAPRASARGGEGREARKTSGTCRLAGRSFFWPLTLHRRLRRRRASPVELPRRSSVSSVSSVDQMICRRYCAARRD
jgi:hypothetical protein